MATSPTLSITASRIGPRSDLSPTSARLIGCWVLVSAIAAATPVGGCTFPAPVQESKERHVCREPRTRLRPLPGPPAAGGAAGRGPAATHEPGGQGRADVPRHGG